MTIILHHPPFAILFCHEVYWQRLWWLRGLNVSFPQLIFYKCLHFPPFFPWQWIHLSLLQCKPFSQLYRIIPGLSHWHSFWFPFSKDLPPLPKPLGTSFLSVSLSSSFSIFLTFFFFPSCFLFLHMGEHLVIFTSPFSQSISGLWAASVRATRVEDSRRFLS